MGGQALPWNNEVYESEVWFEVAPNRRIRLFRLVTEDTVLNFRCFEATKQKQLYDDEQDYVDKDEETSYSDDKDFNKEHDIGFTGKEDNSIDDKSSVTKVEQV